MSYNFKKIEFSKDFEKKLYNNTRRLEILEEYNINTPEELETVLNEYVKGSEELFFCDRCGCKSLRKSDRYCPECGGRVED